MVAAPIAIIQLANMLVGYSFSNKWEVESERVRRSSPYQLVTDASGLFGLPSGTSPCFAIAAGDVVVPFIAVGLLLAPGVPGSAAPAAAIAGRGGRGVGRGVACPTAVFNAADIVWLQV